MATMSARAAIEQNERLSGPISRKHLARDMPASTSVPPTGHRGSGSEQQIVFRRGHEREVNSIQCDRAPAPRIAQD